MNGEILIISSNLANFDLKSIIFHEKKTHTFLDFCYKFSMCLYLDKIKIDAPLNHQNNLNIHKCMKIHKCLKMERFCKYT